MLNLTFSDGQTLVADYNAQGLLLDTRPSSIRVEATPHPDVWNLHWDGQTVRALVLGFDAETKKLSLRIGGQKVALQVQSLPDILSARIGRSAGKGSALAELKSPMPGLIRRIAVQPGQLVTKGETLLTLEAMKMENVIKAPADVLVKAILVQEAQAVDKGQRLIEFGS